MSVILRLYSSHIRIIVLASALVLLAVGAFLILRPSMPRPSSNRPTAPAGPVPAVEPTRFEPVAPDAARAINEALPVPGGAGPAARPFAQAAAAASLDAQRARDCLAAAAFFEAGDDAEGERAVAQVVLNRVRHPAFPKTVCGVVFQGSERRTGCQFTFTCDGSLARRAPSDGAWRRARAVATAALAGGVYAPVGLATHYHADWVIPYWSASLDRIARVGTHLFYRWGGWWGSPGAFRGRVGASEPALASVASLGSSGSGAGALPIRTADAAGTLTVRGPARPALFSSSDPDLFLVRLPRGGADWAARARALCGDRDRCTVMGWTDARLVARSLPLTPGQLSGLAFRYAQQAGEAPIARWNCARVPRRDEAECMGGVLSAMSGAGTAGAG